MELIWNNKRSGLCTALFRRLWESSNTPLLFPIRTADACGRAHASSLFPAIHIKRMHWACCKFLHNASFFIKKSYYSPSLPFDPNVCQGTRTQLLKSWDWRAKDTFAYTHCSVRNVRFSSRAKQLMTLEVYMIPHWWWLTNNLVIEEVQHLSLHKSPSVDQLKKWRTGEVLLLTATSDAVAMV